MIFWFLYSCLCVLLDVEDVRRRVDDPEAELLPLRHELRVVCRQVNGPAWTLQTGAIMAARNRVFTHPALAGWSNQKRSSRGTASSCAANGQRARDGRSRSPGSRRESSQGPAATGAGLPSRNLPAPLRVRPAARLAVPATPGC